MGIFQSLRNLKGNLDIIRSFGDLVDPYRPYTSNETSFFSNIQIGNFFDNVTGLTDLSVRPEDLYTMVHKDSYFAPLFEQLEKALFKNGFKVIPRQTETGRTLGSKLRAKQYEGVLRSIDYEALTLDLFNAEWGDGGGNALLFTVRDKGRVKFRVEPFLAEGQERVRVFGNRRIREVYKYEVISNHDVIMTLTPGKNYLHHYRYSRKGDYRFSSNPAKRAVYWFILKNHCAGSEDSSYRNGPQRPHIISTDYSALSQLSEVMRAGKVSSSSSAPFMRNPLEFIAEMAARSDEILRKQFGQAGRSNQAIRLPLPTKIDQIVRNNNPADADITIERCNKEMGHALRTSAGLLTTEKSKYSNAEMEKDNWHELVLEPVKDKIERLTTEYILPIIAPDFDPAKYQVRFGRDISAEEIEVYRMKTERNNSIATILQKIRDVPGVKYNFKTNQIEEVDILGESKEPETESVEEEIEKQEEEVEEESRSVDRIDEAYSKYHDSVNMSHSELKAWSETDCSSKAGLDRSPIARNLRLLSREKDDWTPKDATDALKTVAFIARMSKNLGGEQDIKDSEGKSCGTKAFISLKNWAYDPSKARAYKDGTPSERALRGTGDFQKSLQKAIEKQIKDAAETQRLKPLSKFGLTVTSLRDMLLKYAKPGLEQDTRDQFPAEVLAFFDAKAQMLLKGWESLTTEQQDLLQSFLSRKIIGYKGLDTETATQIDTIIQANAGSGPKVITQAILDSAVAISEARAKLIVDTEIPQSIEATRRHQFRTKSYTEKRWFTVRDERVRETHKKYKAKGWIPIDEEFGAGVQSPADEIRCRCTVTYRKN